MTHCAAVSPAHGVPGAGAEGRVMVMMVVRVMIRVMVMRVVQVMRVSVRVMRVSVRMVIPVVVAR